MVAKTGYLNRENESGGCRERCVYVCVEGGAGGKQSATMLSLSLSLLPSIPPQMMDSNSGENKTKHSSCCHHNETGT